MEKVGGSEPGTLRVAVPTGMTEKKPDGLAHTRTRKRRDRSRVSLHPLSFEQALGALLTVDPKQDAKEGDDGGS